MIIFEEMLYVKMSDSVKMNLAVEHVSECREEMQDHISPPSASILDFREKASLPVRNRKILL